MKELTKPVRRRSVLQWIAGAPVAFGFGLTHAEMADAQEHAAQAVAGDGYQPAFFNPHEWETVRILADLILPADERSGGATDAGVPEFIDFLMTDPIEEERAREDRQTAMRGGLAWIDAECRRRFGHDFVQCTETERFELLDDIAYSDPDSEDEEAERNPRDLRVAPPRHGKAFFNSFRNLVASGFWSSKMGVEDLQYMGNTATPWNGPPSEVLRRLGLE